MPHRAIAFLLLAVIFGCTKVDDPTLAVRNDVGQSRDIPYKPVVPANPLKEVFWGDLHIHTGLSYDAYTFGVTAMPNDAYRYARGATIKHALGYPISLSRPLDFAAVTDHAEWLGVAPSRYGAESGNRRLNEVVASGNPWRITAHFLKTTFLQIRNGEKRRDNFSAMADASVSQAAWKQIIAAAERHNQPGVFTAFVGYEWTSMPNEDNLHRNVIYRSASVPVLPFSSLDSDNPMELWDELDRQREQGMDALAIPHNGNVSNGRMYAMVDFNGQPLSSTYAESRMRNEPLSEILQVKGSSETHPLLSPQDDFADFEIHDIRLSSSGDSSQPEGGYVRDALKRGLILSRKLNLNPYRFGFIGSSDGHNASSPIEESSYHGKLPMLDGSAGIRLGLSLKMPKGKNRGAMWSSMGLAAVWAEENSRESIFAAMRRKETYATSGPRIRLRFFAGWDVEDDVLEREDTITMLSASAVTMGGNLSSAPRGRSDSPTFVVIAAQDPQGARLDRAQIIKLWIDSEGRSHERVYDVAAADARLRGRDGRFPPLISTVDSDSASYRNTIGGARVVARWKDPSFDPQQSAAYYSRVLEIPTPRWSTYDAARLGVVPPQPVEIQERAISSAIWYDADQYSNPLFAGGHSPSDVTGLNP